MGTEETFESIGELIDKYREVDQSTGRYYGTETATAIFGEDLVEEYYKYHDLVGNWEVSERWGEDYWPGSDNQHQHEVNLSG